MHPEFLTHTAHVARLRALIAKRSSQLKDEQLSRRDRIEFLAQIADARRLLFQVAGTTR